jgi:enamine deaminase RidA (YjgF/YER057c/UK114 family)
MTPPPHPIHLEGAAPPRAALSPAMAAGDFVFISGQVARGDDGRTIGVGDIATQTREVVARIAEILRTLDAPLTSVVSTTVFLPSFDGYAAYDAAYAQAFGGHLPARATLQAGLNDPEFLVEIQATAYVPARHDA